MSDPEWLDRVVEWYSRKTDELEGECVLDGVVLARLQELWGMPSDNPMIDAFEVTPDHVDYLKQFADVNFDFEQFDYFVTAYCTDYEAMRRDGGFMGYFPAPRELPAFPEARRVRPKRQPLR